LIASGLVPIIVSTFFKVCLLEIPVEKILIIALTKSGSLDYALKICQKTQFLHPQCIFSSQAKINLPKDSKKINTYSNSLFSFLHKTFFFVFSGLFFLLKQRKTHKTLILYFTVFHPWNLILVFWSKVLGIKTILTVHDFQTHAGEKSSTTEWVQEMTMRKATHVLFLSHNELAKARVEIKQLENKSYVIGHPLLDVGVENTLEYQNKLKFLFLGRILKYKGIDQLIKTCVKHKLNLTVAGKGTDIKSEPSESFTILNKHLNQSEIDQLLASHHVLVLPYLEASQSGVLTMGVSANMVMVIRGTGGLTEQIDDQSALWIGHQESDLEEALLNISSDPHIYKRIKEGLPQFKIDFSESWENNYRQVIKKIIALH